MNARAVRRRLVVSFAAIAVASLGTLARAQEPDPLVKLDQPSRFAVQLMIDSAQEAGIPSHPLVSVAQHGLQLKADGRRIVDAVRNELRELRTAKGVLGGVSDEELEAAAAVLQAGAKPAQLAAFRVRQKGRSDLEAFIDWADLITRGVSSEDASSAIIKLWQDGADDATFHSLWSNVQSDISSGLNPGAALQNRIRETPGRAPPKIQPPEG
ncbi:MAG TPA: hypothetical protein VHV78_12215 [Gemmatimonadaceae bacterium]|nr:hypothetical protein [Gemmatimonadaceae bacterium]